jgi:hypothetical protein
LDATDTLQQAASLYEASRHDPSKAASIAPAAVLMLFLFNLVYASTWGTVAFLIPTEIFPSRMRAQGNGFGITGWAIGVGWTVLVNPIMFEHLEVCIQQEPHSHLATSTNTFTESHILPICRLELHLDRYRLPRFPRNFRPLSRVENQDMFANTHKHGIEGVDLAKEKQIDCSHEELPYV